MSHVDDGTLHAYLDGELSPVERTRLEAHLTDCPGCRARLDEERALIERAGQLLGLALPPERAMPPLHQLRHPRPRLRWRLPLAWAATVVLALAAGWYVRGDAGRGMRDESQPTVQALSSADSAASPLALDQRAEPGREADRPVDQVPVALEGRATAHAQPAAGAGVVAPPPTTPSPPPQPSAMASGVADEAKAEGSISADSARQILGMELAVLPGIRIRAIRSPGPGAVAIEQQLDSSTVVTLFEWRPVLQRMREARPAAPLARANERLARYVGALRVEIAGPLAADSLSRLLEMVRPQER